MYSSDEFVAAKPIVGSGYRNSVKGTFEPQLGSGIGSPAVELIARIPHAENRKNFGRMLFATEIIKLGPLAKISVSDQQEFAGTSHRIDWRELVDIVSKFKSETPAEFTFFNAYHDVNELLVGHRIAPPDLWAQTLGLGVGATIDVPDLDQEENAGHRFVPSEKLVQLWIDGVSELVNEASIGEAVVVSSNPVKVASALRDKIEDILEGFAEKKAYSYASYQLTSGERLKHGFEVVLADQLMLSVRGAVPFLDQLRLEMVEQSARAPVFKDQWGELELTGNGELTLRLVRDKTADLMSVLYD